MNEWKTAYPNIKPMLPIVNQPNRQLYYAQQGRIVHLRVGAAQYNIEIETVEDK